MTISVVFSELGDTALVFLVPEAEPAVQSWRSAYDPSASEYMPAHITVLYPFIAQPEQDEHILDTIAALCRDQEAIALTFMGFGRFPGVLWLRPTGAGCAELITRVRQRWPDCLPYGRRNLDIIPHLTITDGASEHVMAQAQASVSKHLPLHALISAVALMTFDGERWVCMREFALGPQRR